MYGPCIGISWHHVRVEGFAEIWRQIVALEGQPFRQKAGKPFSYRVRGNAIVPSTTTRLLSRSQFAQAYERLPVAGPGQLSDLQGPSYLYAILTDPRIFGGDPPPAIRVPEGATGRR